MSNKFNLKVGSCYDIEDMGELICYDISERHAYLAPYKLDGKYVKIDVTKTLVYDLEDLDGYVEAIEFEYEEEK